MNSENSKTSKPHISILNLTDKIELYLLYIQRVYYIIKNLKYLLQHGMMKLNYWMDHTLYQIFKIFLSIF